MKETITGVLAGVALIILSWLPGAIAKPDIGELYKDAENAYEDKDLEDEHEERYYLKAIDRYRAALIKSEQKILEINRNITFLKNNAEMASGKRAIDEYKKVLEASQKGSVTEIEKLCMEAEIASGRNYSKIEKLHKEAEIRQENKRYQEAIEKYKVALRRNTQNELIFFNDYQKAISKYREALDKSQKDVPKDLDKITEVDKKIEVLRTKADKAYNDEKIKSLLDNAKNESETAYQQKDFHGAIDKYKEALKEIQKGAAEAIDKYKEALRLSQKNRITAIEKMRKDAEIDEEIASETKNYGEAIRKYKAVLTESLKNTAKLHKNFNVLARYKIALCYANLAYKVADIENLRKEGDEKYDAGDYSTSAQKYEKALEKSQKELAENDEKIKKLREAAETAYSEGKYQEAFDNYIKVIEKSKWGVNTEAQKEAKKLFKEKKYKEAANKYKDALTKSFKWQEGRDFYFLAMEHIKEIDTGDRENALDDYQEGLAYLGAHIKFIKEQDKTKLEEFIQKFPYSRFRPDALYTTGDIITLLEEYPDFPLSNEARFLRAQQFLGSGQFKEAYQDYKAFLDNFPEGASKAEEARYRCLYCRLQLMLKGTPLETPEETTPEKKKSDTLDTLLNDYKNFVHENQNSDFTAAAHFDMGNIYLKQKENYGEASTNFASAVTKADKDANYSEMIPIAILGKSHSDYRLDKFDEVISYLEANGANFPMGSPLFSDYDNLLRSAQSQGVLANLWQLSEQADTAFRNQSYSPAATLYSQVHSANAPNLPEVHMLKFRAKFREGLSYFNLPDFGKSVTAYKKAIDYIEKDLNDDANLRDIKYKCLYNLTVTYERQNDWTNARTTYGKLGDAPTYYDSVHHDLLIGISSNNEEAYLRVITNAPDNNDKNIARINLAKIYFDAGHYPEAYNLYAQVTDDAEAQYMAIVCYYNQVQAHGPTPIDNTVEQVEHIFARLKTSSRVDLVLPAYSAMMQIYGKFEKWSNMVTLAKDVKNRGFSMPDIDNWKRYVELRSSIHSGIDDKINTLLPIIANSLENQEKAKAQLKIGHLRYKARQYEDWSEDGHLVKGAISEYKEVINSPSDVLIAKYQIASCYYQLGQNPEISPVERVGYYNQSITVAQGILGTPGIDTEMQANIHYLLGMANFNIVEIQKEIQTDAASNRQEAITNFEEVVNLESTMSGPSPKFTYGSNLRLAKLYWDAAEYLR